MLTWCIAELQYYTIDVVIKRFLTRLQGRLRDWYHSHGEYRQLQIQQSISPEAFMSIIYSKFIGSPWEHTTHAREEFLKMKCCSFQKKDLEKHYDRMSQRFYCLNGVDDVNLKQVFFNSFPKSIGNEAYQALEARNVTIAQTTLGELYRKKWKFIRKKKQRGRTFDRALYSLDDEPSDSVLCMIGYLDFSSDDDSDIDSLKCDSDFGVHMINPIPYVLPIQKDPPLLLAKIHLLTDAYAKPILVIAIFDTGSLVSILNPNILPDHYWKPHHQNFMAANGEKFVIDKISVPINIQLFSKCVIKRRLLGSSSHGKDLLIGFNILHKLPNLYTRSLMARANGVDPDKIPYYVMCNISIWSKDHPDAYKWIEANGQWLYDNFDHCEVETSDDDDDARSLWSSDDDEHFDPFEDDPTHPDACWSP
uniref:Putative zinc finger, CCHC-type n=1 Tax=Tanacetum cinerariifolium TaxID=118510 RepID=A0A699GJE9_TANCI|nr:putative zinc finger, CCHC-type [Tanacetum cinerariifolium]